ncbi:MAG: hypothetical protein JSV67_02745, partial [Thermoplasmatales archaeon]
QDQTTIGPYRKNTSRDYKVKTNSTILNWGIDPITKANAIESFANIEHYENYYKKSKFLYFIHIIVGAG